MKAKRQFHLKPNGSCKGPGEQMRFTGFESPAKSKTRRASFANSRTPSVSAEIMPFVQRCSAAQFQLKKTLYFSNRTCSESFRRQKFLRFLLFRPDFCRRRKTLLCEQDLKYHNSYYNLKIGVSQQLNRKVPYFPSCGREISAAPAKVP